jgi:hypothetical protein
MAHTVGEIIFMAIDNHPPKAIVGDRVVCACGVTSETGKRYLEHLALFADGEMDEAGYKLTDPKGQPIRSNVGR